MPSTVIGSPTYWCSIAGDVVAMQEANTDPTLLPNHQVQLVMADDGFDAAKASPITAELYTTPATFQPTPNGTLVVNNTQLVSLVVGGLVSHSVSITYLAPTVKYLRSTHLFMYGFIFQVACFGFLCDVSVVNVLVVCVAICV